MESSQLLNYFPDGDHISSIIDNIKSKNCKTNMFLQGLAGSQLAIIARKILKHTKTNHIFILNNLEEALYFLDDLNNLGNCQSTFLFPANNKKTQHNKNSILEKTTALKALNSNTKTHIITFPQALEEAIIDNTTLNNSSISFSVGQRVNFEEITTILEKIKFNEVDFVYEPGCFAIRGFIIDIFSYSNENPCRIVLEDDLIVEISFFNVSSQLSLESITTTTIISNIEDVFNKSSSLFDYLKKNTTVWTKDLKLLENEKNNTTVDKFKKNISRFFCVHTGHLSYYRDVKIVKFNSSCQPRFNKNFNLLIDHLDGLKEDGYNNTILVSSENQMSRLQNLLQHCSHLVKLIKCTATIKEGFLDRINKRCFYTDHELFERHHQYKSKRIYKTENALNIKELTKLKKGDYITHFDYGIGLFDGFRKKNNLETIRLIYKNNDILYISIHALHKISKFKDASNKIQLDKLGSPRWKNLKDKAKNKIKLVAFDLIKLYAKRKMTKGFSFSQDTYLQNELEASFIFQETPDQIKINKEIKSDMESQSPMDRLVCGDVGFGKTELAIRSAFKAVSDNKQVAILVPTTILALQHYKTFEKRLSNFPCTIKYINRFVQNKEKLQILQQLEDGLVDIIIGTHRLISKDVKFKDLGLLIIDEEQKFGVSVKDKLKTIKESVDTLTLTATPIPRTLQFSLMGSRDLSIMTTYPQNRNPIETSICDFNYELIKKIISFEIAREGQVFFVHNRVSNIKDFHNMISSMLPKVEVRFAHGKMESKKLESTILDFINGQFDVLITTTIIENGLDVPNANTIIINEAQNFGLSDLHQMRGRVGRSNKQAFCYLMTPPFSKMTDIAVKRLKAISNLSNLGDGFNIALKDLEIRGAGNMLGAEQSGFIEDMGFANYQKILDEAITELKTKKFKLLENTNHNSQLRCIIESDLNLSIPTEYIYDTSERIALYNRLSRIRSNDEIQKYKSDLIDRFGSIPKPTQDLINSIVFRHICEKIHCHKVILKKETMILFFESNNQSSSFNKIFENIVKLINQNNDRFSVKEDNQTFKLYVNRVLCINEAIKIINCIKN